MSLVSVKGNLLKFGSNDRKEIDENSKDMIIVEKDNVKSADDKTKTF